MDAEYTKERLAHMHEEVVRLKVQLKALRNCIRILRAIAIVGWVAFIVTLIAGA